MDNVGASINAIVYALEGNHEKAKAVIRNAGLDTDRWANFGNWEMLASTAVLLGANDSGPINQMMDRMAEHGLPELGPLYGPAGDWGTATVAGLGTRQVEAQERCLKYSRWFARMMTPLTVVPRPSRIRSLWKGEMTTAGRDTKPRGYGWTMTPGPRGEFGSGMGWHSESPATVLMQWVAGASGRFLPRRWSTYQPHQDMVWDYLFWALQKATGTPYGNTLDIGITDSERKAMRRHWKDGTLYDELLGHGGFRTRFGLESVRFADGSLLIIAHRNTASPKSPVPVIDWDGPSKDQVLHVPDGHTNQGARGEGRLETGGGGVWGVSYSSRTEVTSRSKVRPISEVVRHLVMPARSDAGWELGELDPESGSPPPPAVSALTPPTLLAPQHESIQPLGEVSFEWQPVEGASGYRFTASGGVGGGAWYSTLDLPTIGLSVDVSVDGPVWWKVKALPDGPDSELWMFHAADVAVEQPAPPPDDRGLWEKYKWYIVAAALAGGAYAIWAL